MTHPDTAHPGLVHEFGEIVTAVAIPHHEPPAVVLRRRIVVAVVLVIGAALLGYSLARQPGDRSFYWLMVAVAGVWAVGAFASGPLHLGSIRLRGRNQRPVISGTAIGLVLGGLFLLGSLVARQIPGMTDYVSTVLRFANFGAYALVVLITLINAFAEELFFRGALYTALGRAYPTVISTVLYVAAVAATGNPMLVFAAIILGTVCAIERRATGGVLAPILTHVFWGLLMVLGLPPIFGI
jgi:membrane protease YdiL (CAAX protease family)